MGYKTFTFLASAVIFSGSGAAAQGFDANTFRARSGGDVPVASPSEVVENSGIEDPNDPSTWVGSRGPASSDFEMQYSGQVDGTENFQHLLTGVSILKSAVTFDDYTYGTGRDQVVCTTLIKYSLLDYMARTKYTERQIAYVRGLSNGAPEMREQLRKDIAMAEEAGRRLEKLRTIEDPSEAQKKLIRDYSDMAERVPFESVPVDKKQFLPGDVLFFSSRHVVFYVQPHADKTRLGIYHAAGVKHDVTYSGIPMGFIMKAFRLKVKNTKGA